MEFTKYENSHIMVEGVCFHNDLRHFYLQIILCSPAAFMIHIPIAVIDLRQFKPHMNVFKLIINNLEVSCFPEYEVGVTLADGCNCLLPEIRILSLSVPSYSNG
jgi:hypothetical protein